MLFDQVFFVFDGSGQALVKIFGIAFAQHMIPARRDSGSFRRLDDAEIIQDEMCKEYFLLEKHLRAASRLAFLAVFEG